MGDDHAVHLSIDQGSNKPKGEPGKLVDVTIGQGHNRKRRVRSEGSACARDRRGSQWSAAAVSNEQNAGI